MFNLPEWGPDFAEVFASILFASIIGKFMGQESRVLTMCLIGAVLTDSWQGVFVAALVALVPWVVDLVKGMA